uniref:Uncharacterized protein n=1 Tax=Anopheles culicifacies TaxID=139723 RepID=A0A182MV35_9DIPT
MTELSGTPGVIVVAVVFIAIRADSTRSEVLIRLRVGCCERNANQTGMMKIQRKKPIAFLLIVAFGVLFFCCNNLYLFHMAKVRRKVDQDPAEQNLTVGLEVVRRLWYAWSAEELPFQSGGGGPVRVTTSAPFEQHHFNRTVSDRLGVVRPIPDTRHPK